MITTGQFTDKSGKFWQVEGEVNTWPVEAQEAIKEMFGSDRDKNLCDFGDWVCPISSKKYCGGIPPYNVQQKPAQMTYPYWVIYERISKPIGLAEQQLSLFDDPIKLYEFCGRKSTKSHWWVSMYWCAKGVRWANHYAQANPEVYQVIVHRVNKAFRKRTTIQQEDTNQWKNPEGCVTAGGL